VIRAPRGTQLTCKGWLQEAAMHCFENPRNFDKASG